MDLKDLGVGSWALGIGSWALGIGAALSVSFGASAAQDWNQWRGPSRNGTVAATATPKWPAAFKRAWRAEVGEGYSSPVVSGGRVFVHGRKDPDELVTAIDLASGTIVWQSKYTSAFNKNQYATKMAKGPH